MKNVFRDFNTTSLFASHQSPIPFFLYNQPPYNPNYFHERERIAKTKKDHLRKQLFLLVSSTYGVTSYAPAFFFTTHHLRSGETLSACLPWLFHRLYIMTFCFFRNPHICYVLRVNEWSVLITFYDSIIIFKTQHKIIKARHRFSNINDLIL